ncbi:MAG: 3-deoxy-manno-octulosonate cytidylyltransferase [Mangrovibacterium sp.]
MKYITIIPARYQSTRFPGKPLALLGEKPIIQHVYENALKATGLVWVATDDERIAGAVERFGGRVVMTQADHQSGTDRCAEAAEKIGCETDFDVVINIQGDEPFIRTEQMEALKGCFSDPQTCIATLIRKPENREELFNPNRPKVVTDKEGYALFFSRSVIPYIRGKKEAYWLPAHPFYCHLGMYAYRKDILPRLTRLVPSSLELAESLEQLRWLENGYRIRTAITSFDSKGIDTPEDLECARKMLAG